MLKLLERTIDSLDRRLVLLAPSTTIPAVFQNSVVDERHHRSLLNQMQALRGGVYFADGAVGRAQLSSDGRHETIEDEQSWHLLTVDERMTVTGCACVPSARRRRERSGSAGSTLPSGEAECVAKPLVEERGVRDHAGEARVPQLRGGRRVGRLRSLSQNIRRSRARARRIQPRAALRRLPRHHDRDDAALLRLYSSPARWRAAERWRNRHPFVLRSALSLRDGDSAVRFATSGLQIHRSRGGGLRTDGRRAGDCTSGTCVRWRGGS